MALTLNPNKSVSLNPNKEINIAGDNEIITVTFNVIINTVTTQFAQFVVLKDIENILKPTTDPTREGFTFDGWSNGVSIVSFPLTSSSDITFVAVFTEIPIVTASFDSDGGSPTFDDQIGASPFLVTDPGAPAKTGYNFLGWEPSIGTPITEDTTFVANWIAKTSAITFNPQTGNGATNAVATYDSAMPTTGYYLEEDFPVLVQNMTIPSLQHYTFVGYYSGQNKTGLKYYGFSNLLLTSARLWNITLEETTLYAGWDPVQYTITFDSNGGTAVTSITQDYNTTVAEPTAPTKTNYTFDGWYEDESDDDGTGVLVTWPTTMTGNVTYYAKWAPDQITISFDSNGGSAVADIVADYGSQVNEPAEPTKSGYSFEGWFYNTQLTTAVNWPITALIDDTLYAKWSGIEYLANLNPENNLADIIRPTFGEAMPTIGFNTTDGETLINPPEERNLLPLSQTGYTFNGYYYNGVQYYNSSMASARTWNQASNGLTLSANFTIITYTITYNLNSGTNNASNPTSYNVTTPTITLLNASRVGYTFGGWYTDSALATSKSSIPQGSTGNVTLYAKWTIESYTINTVENLAGVTVANPTGNYGSTIITPADPSATGYTFEGWFDNAGLLGDQFVFPATFPDYGATGTIVNVYAKWRAHTYDVVFDKNDSGATGTMADQSFIYGVSQNLRALGFAKTGYSFAGWATSSNGSPSYTNQQSVSNLTSTDEGTFNLFARWSIDQYTITFDSNSGSAVNSVTQNYNTTLNEPTAPTRTGYSFEGWFYNTQLTTAVNWPITITESDTLYAKWIINQYTITFDSNGGTAVSSQTVNYNATVSEPTDPTRTGYDFDGWYYSETNNNGSGTPVSWPITVTANDTVHAKWSGIEYEASLNPESNGAEEIRPVFGDPMPSTGLDYFENDEPIFPPAIKTLTVPSRAGYNFNGYYVGSTQYYTNTMSSARTWNIANNTTTLNASYSLITYSITYNLNSGTNNQSNPTSYNIESAAITFASPTQQGYTFVGWYSNPALTTPKSGIPTGSTGNVVVYAKWTIESYTINTIENGGSSVANPSGNFGDVISAPADPTKTGYTFAGWFDNAGLLGDQFVFPATFPDYGATGTTVNVYAKWTAITYTVAYNGNTNTGGSTTSSTHTYDVPKNLTANGFTKTNYTFQGWATSSGGAVVYSNQDSVTNLRNTSGTFTLWAKWRGVSMIVTFDANEGSVTTPTKTVYYQETYGTLPTPTRTGYNFVGWYTALSNGNQVTSSTVVNETSAHTLFAIWQQQVSYSLTPASSSVNEGSSINIVVNTTAVANNTTLYWRVNIPYGNTTDADFSSPSNPISNWSSIVINNNTATITVSIFGDGVVESAGPEVFRIALGTAPVDATIVAYSSIITINDVLKTATPTTAFLSSTTSSIVFRLTNNDASSASMTWQIRTVSASGTIVASGTTSLITGSVDVGYYSASASTTYFLTGVRATASNKLQSDLGVNRSGTTQSSTPQTATPTVNSISCIQDPFIGEYSLSASIKNNDASSVTMEISRASNFLPKITSTFTGGQTKTVTVSTSSSSFNGSQTIYARATASGETLSQVGQATQNITCFTDGGFG